MGGEGPAPIHKLGHFGMCVTNFAKAFEFYTARFNFKPSDVSDLICYSIFTYSNILCQIACL